MAAVLFRCGVIEESLESRRPLLKLKPYLVRSRTESLPQEDPPQRHVNEYLVPREDLVDLLPWIEADIKGPWYAHAFNMEEGALYVVLHGRSFKLPTVRDARWDAMIEYGKSVGCDPKWTENVPLTV